MFCLLDVFLHTVIIFRFFFSHSNWQGTKGVKRVCMRARAHVCVYVCASVLCVWGRERIVCVYTCVSVPLCERLACELD